MALLLPLRNRLKHRVLSALQGRGWQTAAAVAALAKVHPKRAVYQPLNRYLRWGLIRRRRRDELFIYKVSVRGLARLAWLKRRDRRRLEWLRRN